MFGNIQDDLLELDELDLLENVGEKTTSPTLEKLEQYEQENGKIFSFEDLGNAENKEIDFLEINESEINEQMQESTDAESMEDVAEVLIETLDFALEKGLNMFGRDVKENKSTERKKKNLSKMLSVLMVKWGVKFKLEYLALIMLFSYIFAKYKDSTEAEQEYERKALKDESEKTRVKAQPLKKETPKGVI